MDDLGVSLERDLRIRNENNLISWKKIYVNIIFIKLFVDFHAITRLTIFSGGTHQFY